MEEGWEAGVQILGRKAVPVIDRPEKAFLSLLFLPLECSSGSLLQRHL